MAHDELEHLIAALKPPLVVKQLSSCGRGKLGLWCGNTSGGDFANLKIISAE